MVLVIAIQQEVEINQACPEAEKKASQKAVAQFSSFTRPHKEEPDKKHLEDDNQIQYFDGGRHWSGSLATGSF